MKIIMIVAALLTSISLASASCPQGTKTLATCLSTPGPGDNEVAAAMLDAISICSQGTQIILVPQKNGESDQAVAKVTQRAGGTTYVIETSDIDFSLTVTTATNSKTSAAKLKIDFKSNNLTATSSYTCKR